MIVTFSSCQDSAAKKINSSSTVAKTNQISQETAADGPVMTFEKTTHDFGTINEGDKVTTQFSFTNTGKADPVIVDARGSCGCTVQNIPKMLLLSLDNQKLLLLVLIRIINQACSKNQLHFQQTHHLEEKC